MLSHCLPRPRRRFARASLALLSTASLLLTACQEIGDDTEVATQKLTTQKYAVRVHNNNTRYVEMKCEEVCSVLSGRCAPWCVGGFLKEIKLLADRNATTAYPATATGEYKGCGISAIANMANYIIGGGFTTDSVDSWAGGHNWGFFWPLSYLNKDKGMTPDKVEQNLKTGLGDYQHRYFTSMTHNASLPANLPDIIESLKAGYPVIMLVNGGYHFQVITGYKAPDELYMIDYTTPITNKPLKTRKFADLGFDNLGKLPSALFGFQGYHPGTYIKVTGYELAPSGTPGAGTGGGEGVPCGDNPDSPRCEGGQQLNSFCQCDCPEDDRRSCSNQSGREYDNSTCTCRESQGL